MSRKDKRHGLLIRASKWDQQGENNFFNPSMNVLNVVIDFGIRISKVLSIVFYMIYIFTTLISCSPKLATRYVVENESSGTYDSLFIDPSINRFSLKLGMYGSVEKIGMIDLNKDCLILMPEIRAVPIEPVYPDTCVLIRIIDETNHIPYRNTLFQINGKNIETDSEGCISICEPFEDSLIIDISKDFHLGKSRSTLTTGYKYELLVPVDNWRKDQEFIFLKVVKNGLKEDGVLIWKNIERIEAN